MSETMLKHDSHQAELPRDAATEICKDGAQRLLAAALEAEVDAFLTIFAELRGPDGIRLVVRNGPCAAQEGPASSQQSPHQTSVAGTQKDAKAASSLFREKYEAKDPKAAKCLAKDEEQLLSFYDSPAEHWKHLRTTNPIESTFATVRLRHTRYVPRHGLQTRSLRRAQLAETQRTRATR